MPRAKSTPKPTVAPKSPDRQATNQRGIEYTPKGDILHLSANLPLDLVKAPNEGKAWSRAFSTGYVDVTLPNGEKTKLKVRVEVYRVVSETSGKGSQVFG